MGECEEERNTSSVRRNCYWLILCNSWVLPELCLEKCGSQNSKRAPKLLFSAVQTPYNPLPLNVGESSGYHRLSLPWLGHTIWQRWRDFAGVMKVHFSLGSSKERLSWVGLTYSDGPFNRGCEGKKQVASEEFSCWPWISNCHTDERANNREGRGL